MCVQTLWKSEVVRCVEKHMFKIIQYNYGNWWLERERCINPMLYHVFTKYMLRIIKYTYGNWLSKNMVYIRSHTICFKHMFMIIRYSYRNFFCLTRYTSEIIRCFWKIHVHDHRVRVRKHVWKHCINSNLYDYFFIHVHERQVSWKHDLNPQLYDVCSNLMKIWSYMMCCKMHVQHHPVHLWELVVWNRTMYKSDVVPCAHKIYAKYQQVHIWKLNF